MFKSYLCDYSDAYIPVKRTRIAVGADTVARETKKAIFTNYEPFID